MYCSYVLQFYPGFSMGTHCVKSAQIWSFFCGPYFPVFELNTGKYGPEKPRIWRLFKQKLLARYFQISGEIIGRS